MAVARITVFRHVAPDEAALMLGAVHDSLVEVLQVPKDDPTVWIAEHSRGLARFPARHGPELTFVEVTLFAGRTEHAKRQLHEALAAKLDAVGVPRATVLVVLLESPRENWSVGGTSQDQVDVGFRIDI